MSEKASAWLLSELEEWMSERVASRELARGTGMSLRRRINQNCKACVWDNRAKGTWRQQVTLCAIKSCPFHEVRPKTDSKLFLALF